LKYENLYKKDEISNLARKQYKENTNVFAYYFIKSILLFNAEKFMKWCDKNQINILIFSKNTRHLNKFFKFIKHHYKENDFIKNINNLQIKHNEIINNDFLSNNLRMTVCELEL
jgi:predicted hydrocarbon binding protein